jgi:hypothetical protein
MTPGEHIIALPLLDELDDPDDPDPLPPPPGAARVGS